MTLLSIKFIMKDVVGNELMVGDRVVTNWYGGTDRLVICEVVGFTPKKIKLILSEEKFRGVTIDLMKFPEQVCLIR